jgi:hypothetical protein
MNRSTHSPVGIELELAPRAKASALLTRRKSGVRPMSFPNTRKATALTSNLSEAILLGTAAAIEGCSDTDMLLSAQRELNHGPVQSLTAFDLGSALSSLSAL